MKGSKCVAGLLAACLLPLFGGCSAALNPLEKAEATPVPGLSMELHPASASQDNVDTLSASLYYRFGDQPLLAAEARTLTVPKDESKELAIIRALLDGPSSGHSDLKRLFPETVEALGISSRSGTLYVTFNEALLTDDGVPESWQESSVWVNEAPLRRALAIQSVVASITESFPYTGVQILVYKENQVESSLRLENSYFLNGSQGLSEPQPRNEAMLLTPGNMTFQLMKTWHDRNYESLYQFIAYAEGNEPKPSLQDVSQALDAAPTLASFVASGGSVSQSGAQAVVSVQLSLLGADGPASIASYPLPLIRENGIWKVAYSSLIALMLPENP